MKVAQLCLPLCNPIGLYSPWNSLGQNTGVGSLPLLQGIFPTQGSNPFLSHCRQILYQLSHKIAILISNEIDFRTKIGTGDIEIYYIMIKGSSKKI